MPVRAWIHSKYNKVKEYQVLVRLTAGWPINWALERPTQQPLVWRHEPDRTSDFRGVSLFKERGLWRASMKCVDSRAPKAIAYCTDELLAAAVYNVCARWQYGMAARLNLT